MSGLHYSLSLCRWNGIAEVHVEPWLSLFSDFLLSQISVEAESCFFLAFQVTLVRMVVLFLLLYVLLTFWTETRGQNASQCHRCFPGSDRCAKNGFLLVWITGKDMCFTSKPACVVCGAKLTTLCLFLLCVIVLLLMFAPIYYTASVGRFTCTSAWIGQVYSSSVFESYRKLTFRPSNFTFKCTLRYSVSLCTWTWHMWTTPYTVPGNSLLVNTNKECFS